MKTRVHRSVVSIALILYFVSAITFALSAIVISGRAQESNAGTEVRVSFTVTPPEAADNHAHIIGFLDGGEDTGDYYYFNSGTTPILILSSIYNVINLTAIINPGTPQESLLLDRVYDVWLHPASDTIVIPWSSIVEGRNVIALTALGQDGQTIIKIFEFFFQQTPTPPQAGFFKDLFADTANATDSQWITIISIIVLSLVGIIIVSFDSHIKKKLEEPKPTSSASSRVFRKASGKSSRRT